MIDIEGRRPLQVGLLSVHGAAHESASPKTEAALMLDSADCMLLLSSSMWLCDWMFV